MKRELELVVISDVHLGTYGCHAKELLNYLKSIKPDTLIINGDFIDIWQFRKRYFPKEHLQVIQRILKMAAKGTKVFYVTGNHDDALRRYSDFSSGAIHLRDQVNLRLNGKSYWIFHGDVFDTVIHYSPLIAKIGGKGYDWLIVLNRFINKLRMAFGKPRMSFAKRVKDRVKEAVKFIGDFEKSAIDLAFEQNHDFVICGHIHKPQMRTITRGDRQLTYLNSGDWVENLTALEYNWGRWTIYEYDELDYPVTNPKLKVNGQEVIEEDEVLEPVSADAVFAQLIQGANRTKPTSQAS